MTRQKPAIDPSDLPGARRASQPDRFRPQLATLAAAPPLGEGWLHEIKYDGYRLLAMLGGGRVRLLTRRGQDWTDRFPRLASGLRRLPLSAGILDGEVVVLDAEGRESFQALQNFTEGSGSDRLVYHVFDMPYCQGYNLARVPLLRRKELLDDLLPARHGEVGLVRYSDHIAGGGPAVLQQACRLALEGIVSKRADAYYEQRRTRTWVKVKCVLRQEFVVGGWTDPRGSRRQFGALLIGCYDEQGVLRYAGKVGAGFAEATLQRLSKRLAGLGRRQPPFADPPRERAAHWVEPRLVVEIQFSEWTADGRLRQPSFLGVREDRPPTRIVRERAESAAAPGSRRLRRPADRRERAGGTRRGKPMSSKFRDGEIEIAGVRLTNPDRVLYPEQGTTKAQLAHYYELVAELMLPHVAGRPLSLLRCPEGRQEQCFFQKHFTGSLPASLNSVTIAEKEQRRPYIVVENLAGLVGLVQLGVLEIHAWGSRADRIERPDLMTFDLDPGPSTGPSQLVQTARLVHDRLEALGLASWVKTSGGKGLHVVVPLRRRSGWDEVKGFARALAEELAGANPSELVATMSKSKRQGRIFIDYLRNARGATSVAPYSTRARKGAPVSTPRRWDEIAGASPDAYTLENLPSRLAALMRNPWAGMSDVRQSLTLAMRREMGMKR
jgi:bifunctional non-homologous end joining protein LigD